MRVLVVYCANGRTIWAYRKHTIRGYRFLCLDDGFSVDIVVDTPSDIVKIINGIQQHSVSLRGAFQRVEHWVDL